MSKKSSTFAPAFEKSYLVHPYLVHFSGPPTKLVSVGKSGGTGRPSI